MESQTDSRYDRIVEQNTPENEIKSLSGVSKFDTHKQRKRDFNLGKNILRELKNILAELLSIDKIGRIGEIK